MLHDSADPDQLASSSQLIWIYIVCKGRVYPGSAEQGLNWLFKFAFAALSHRPNYPTSVFISKLVIP